MQNTLTAITLKGQLEKLNACEDAIEWVDNKTIEQAWAECPRGDWMLWLYVRSKNVDQRKLYLAKGYCAKTVEHLMKDQRSKDAVKAAIDFGNGIIDKDQLAYAAADAAAYAAAAYAAAAYAAADAADAAAADADAAADAAAYAAAAAAARKINRQATADICRQYLPMPEFM